MISFSAALVPMARNGSAVVVRPGTKYSAIFRPELSCLHIDMAEVGKRAMYMLTDLLSDSLYDKKAEFNGTPIKRDSTRF